MKEWIMELCPEIAEWQAELIEQNVMNMVLHEREAIAKKFDGPVWSYDYREIAAAIRARNKS